MYFVDHGSEKDLRALKIDGVSAIRADQTSYFQDEFTNLGCAHFAIADRYDWLFPLDVDEFLPFASRDSLEEFTRRYADAPTVAMYWWNGFPAAALTGSYRSLTSDATVIMYPKPSRQYKSSVNISQVGRHFRIGFGNHQVMTRLAFLKAVPVLGRLAQFRPAIAPEPLYHLPSTGAGQLGSKISKFKALNNAQRRVAGAGGGIHSYPSDYDLQSWLSFVAHYREHDFAARPVTIGDFEETEVLRLDRAVALDVEAQLLALPHIERTREMSPAESAYIDYKARHSGRQPRGWFSVREDAVVLQSPASR
jgi:hypothetical protein